MKRGGNINMETMRAVEAHGRWYINGCQIPRSSLTKKGKPRKVKRCATCGKVRPLVEFSKLRCHPFYCLGIHCFACRNTRADRRHKESPFKRRANQLVKQAIERGALKRERCAVCARQGRKPQRWEWSVAHHYDYSRPLSVVWLCHSHHKAWHKLFLAEIYQ